MLNHYDYIKQHKGVSVLSKKEIKYLGDKLLLSDDSSDAQLKNDLKELKKITQRKKKRTINQITHFTLSRRSTTFAQQLYLKYERMMLRFGIICTKIQKSLRFEKPYIVSPDGSPKMLWDLMCLLIVVYEMITIPLQISYEVDISETFSRVITGIFGFDILLNFNTGIYVDGYLKLDRYRIIQEYLRLWFWIDLISTFPYDIILEESSYFIQSARLLRLLKFLRFIKILKLLRLAKLKKIIDRFDELLKFSQEFAAAITFIKLFVFVLFLGHILGCIFHYVGMQEDPEESWLAETFFTDWYHRYIDSLYWGIQTMTTIGYGDITPQNTEERLMGVFLLLVASTGFAFTMNSIGAALQQIGDKTNEKKQMMSKVNKYMKKAKINDSLQNKIRKYLEFVWSGNREMVLDQLTQELSEELQDKVKHVINGKMLGYVTIFWSNHSEKFLVEVLTILRERLYAPQEVIINELDYENHSNDLYIVQSGEVDIFYMKTGVVVDRKEKKDYFGEISFYSSLKRSASAKSVSFSSIFFINQVSFLNRLKSFKHDLEKFHLIRHKITFQHDYSVVNIRCYTCQMDDHIARDCPQLHFHIAAPHYLQFLNQHSNIQQSIFVRSDRVDINARKDLALVQNNQKVFCKNYEQIKKFLASQSNSRNSSFNNLEADQYESDEDNPQFQMVKLQVLEKNCKIKLKSKFKRHSIQSNLLRTRVNPSRKSIYSEEELLERQAFERINKYLLEFQKKNSYKTQWKEFSMVPNLDRYCEYMHYFPEGNIKRTLKIYNKLRLTLEVRLHQPPRMGMEELSSFADYYGLPLNQHEITQYLIKSQNMITKTVEQQLLAKMGRREKKAKKLIRQGKVLLQRSIVKLKAITGMTTQMQGVFKLKLREVNQ